MLLVFYMRFEGAQKLVYATNSRRRQSSRRQKSVRTSAKTERQLQTAIMTRFKSAQEFAQRIRRRWKALLSAANGATQTRKNAPRCASGRIAAISGRSKFAARIAQQRSAIQRNGAFRAPPFACRIVKRVSRAPRLCATQISLTTTTFALRVSKIARAAWISFTTRQTNASHGQFCGNTRLKIWDIQKALQNWFFQRCLIGVFFSLLLKMWIYFFVVRSVIFLFYLFTRCKSIDRIWHS